MTLRRAVKLSRFVRRWEYKACFENKGLEESNKIIDGATKIFEFESSDSGLYIAEPISRDKGICQLMHSAQASIQSSRGNSGL